MRLFCGCKLEGYYIYAEATSALSITEELNHKAVRQDNSKEIEMKFVATSGTQPYHYTQPLSSAYNLLQQKHVHGMLYHQRILNLIHLSVSESLHPLPWAQHLLPSSPAVVIVIAPWSLLPARATFLIDRFSLLSSAHTHTTLSSVNQGQALPAVLHSQACGYGVAMPEPSALLLKARCK